MAVLGVVSNTQVAVKQFAGRIAMHETTLIRNLLVLEREDWVAEGFRRAPPARAQAGKHHEEFIGGRAWRDRNHDRPCCLSDRYGP